MRGKVNITKCVNGKHIWHNLQRRVGDKDLGKSLSHCDHIKKKDNGK